MRTKLLSLCEKLVVLLMVLTFALPLALAAWLRFSHDQSQRTAWLRNATFAGTPYAFKDVPPKASNLLSARYQAALADNYDHSFPARELVIRSINELYVRAFAVSTRVEIGRGGSLFWTGDLNDWTTDRVARDLLRGQVRRLRQFQDFCEARKIPFALMITPNKAAVYPEDIPWSWKRRIRPGLRRYDMFIPLLKEMGIHYVDGHQISMDLKPTVPVPLFPTGGIHWGDQPSFATGNELLRVLASQGLPVQPTVRFTTKITDQPRDPQDHDLTMFLNAITQPRYPVMEITPEPQPMPDRYRPNAVFIGGSFSYKVMKMLDWTGQFSELDYYNYYKIAKECQTNGEIHRLFMPAPKVNFETEIFAADAIVLEINEQLIRQRNHVKFFLRDALAVLPDPHSPKAPYHYLGGTPYRWGDTLPIANKGAMNRSSLIGFMEPAEMGAFTSEPVSTVRLVILTPPPGDMVLSVNASALLDAARLPEQRAEIYVNGHHLGQWVWTVGAPDLHELPVPKAYLGGGELRVEFRVARPVSTAELGLNSDPRKLGIFVSKIRLYEAGK